MNKVTQPLPTALLLIGLFLSLLSATPAQAQFGWGSGITESVKTGEITVYMKDGSVRQSEKVALLGGIAQFSNLFSDDRIDAELIDHVEVINKRGGEQYFANFQIERRGFLGLSTIQEYRWLERDFATDRMEIWLYEEVSYSPGVDGDFGVHSESTTFYQKDGGALRVMVPQNVVEDVADDEAALAVAQKAQNNTQSGKVLRTGMGVLVGTFVVLVATDNLKERTLLGLAGSTIALLIADLIVESSVKKDMRMALEVYDGAW